MPSPDASQSAFCRSPHPNIRLLAPAGCGKTFSLLHRCRELAQRASHRERFLIVTFTRSATAELKDRLAAESSFAPLKGVTNVTTLNAYGWNRIRSQVSSPRLLTTKADLFFAMKNQLHPLWSGNKHLEHAVTKPGPGARSLMTVMDNMKSLGFVHTRDLNRESYLQRLSDLEREGLSWRITEQFELLTSIGVLEPPRHGDTEGPSTSRRQFYDRFFTFWRKATSRLLEESTFTFEDQKYWTYLDLAAPTTAGKPKVPLSGAARYDHVLVDEFQDINPLDLYLVQAIVKRHRASLTIVGDDDQAIFEWRGASPEYILHPSKYFGFSFRDYQLKINYRSPRNIVELSQNLIENNANREPKAVSADRSDLAKIELRRTDSIGERLRLVTQIVKSTEYPGKVAVIGRLRRQLIPYQIFFATNQGAPFSTAVDLDVFNSNAFTDLAKLLEIWERSTSRSSTSRTVDDAISICDLIRRLPLSRKNRASLRTHLRSRFPKTVASAIDALRAYDGPKLSGKSHQQLHEYGSAFLAATDVADALRTMERSFSGLRFDWEKAEDDVFFTAPPLAQLAEIVSEQGLGVGDLIDRIETVKVQAQEYRELEQSDNDPAITSFLERPLHLMTATRAKGKEFDTVILLDTVDGIWPHKLALEPREVEGERRLFYVAFTRARRRVVMLGSTDTGLTSRFVGELGLE